MSKFAGVHIGLVVASSLVLLEGVSGSSSAKEDSTIYRNETYMFSVNVPEPWKCDTDPPPRPDHGCRIRLSDTAEIVVSAWYNVLSIPNSRMALMDDVGAWLAPGALIGVKTRDTVTLGGLTGDRIAFEYRAAGSAAERRTMEMVVAFRDRADEEDIIYEARLACGPADYERYAAIFRQVLDSWKNGERQ